MNPLIIRGIRERLRPKHLIAAGLFSLIICSTIYLSAYLDGKKPQYQLDPISKTWNKGEPSEINGARNAFTFLIVLQGFYLMFLGTGRVAAITAEERESGLLDYQRMTPMNPLSKILGYVFGLPAREYYMFLFTLPFLLHCVIVGQLPWANILQLYAVFFCSVFLYHLTAHGVGLIVPKPRAASWVSRITVLGLYVVLPGLGQAGISFLSFLTILPTYFGKILPILKFEGVEKLGRFEMKAVQFWEDVPFFDFLISPTSFTFFMQGLIILALLVTAYRKWRNQALPAFSKPAGLILYTIFQFLLLGSLWTFFTKGNASGLLGDLFSTNTFGNTGELANELILVQSIFWGLSLFAILSLINICCPNQHLYLKGIQRSEKLQLDRVPRSADEGSGAWFACSLAVLTGIVHVIFSHLIANSEVWNGYPSVLDTITIPILMIVTVSLYLQAARELWFNLGFWGFVGLLWITPLLTCLVLAVGWEEEFINGIMKLLSICPTSIIPLHLILEYSNMLEIPKEFNAPVEEAIVFGLILSFCLALFLQIRLRLKRR